MTMLEVYDSLEAMLEGKQKNRVAADARVQSWQHEIEPGDLVVREEQGFSIYAEVLDPIESERDALGLGPGQDPEDDEVRAELEWAEQTHGAGWKQSYRFAKQYSSACVDGELGDFHLCTAVGFLTRDEFELAQERGWPSWQYLLGGRLPSTEPQRGA